MFLHTKRSLKFFLALSFVSASYVSANTLKIDFPGCLAERATNYCDYTSHSFLLPEGAWIESILFKAHDDIGFNHHGHISVSVAGREVLNESVKKRGSIHETVLDMNIPKGTAEHNRLVRVQAQFDDVRLEYARILYFVEE